MPRIIAIVCGSKPQAACDHFGKSSPDQSSTSLIPSGYSQVRATPRRKLTSKNIAFDVGVMISKCANPNCSKLLMRMDGGRFYGFPTTNKTIEHFWLCSSCSKNFVLRQVEGRIELLRRDRRIA